MAFKKQLHVSVVSSLASCGWKHNLRHIKAIHRPRAPNLAVGSSAHRANAGNLTYKVASDGKLLPQDEVRDLARDALNDEANKGEGISEDGITKIDNQLKGKLVDESVRCADIHYNHVAPEVNPGKSIIVSGGEEIVVPDVERPYVLEMSNYPFNLAGTIDLIDRVDGKKMIRDSKTSRRKPDEFIAKKSVQGTAYTMALHYTDQVPYPIDFDLDYLLLYKDPANDAHVKRCGQRTREHEKAFLRVFETACKMIEAGIFMPADPGGFMSPCGFCEYRHGDCMYYRDPKTVAF